MVLSAREKSILMGLARDAIRLTLGGYAPGIPPAGLITPRLREKSGAFVSIYANREMRGSMGHILPLVPVWQAVRESAVYAAFRDPRFSPLAEDEMDDITLEIAVLTPHGHREGPSDIGAGTRGVIYRKGFRQGALLPRHAEFQQRRGGKERPAGGFGPCLREWGGADALEVFSAEVFGE